MYGYIYSGIVTVKNYGTEMTSSTITCVAGKVMIIYLHFDLSVPVSPTSERLDGYGALLDTTSWDGRGSFSLADRGSCGSVNR